MRLAERVRWRQQMGEYVESNLDSVAVNNLDHGGTDSVRDLTSQLERSQRSPIGTKVNRRKRAGRKHALWWYERTGENVVLGTDKASLNEN